MNSSKGHILLVEDEPHLAFNLQLNLKAEGYTVDHAPNGREALQLYQSKQVYDLALLDVMIPEPDGLKVAQTIRANDKQLAVILLTARASDKDRLDGLELGVDDYITKPFHLKELLLKVKRAVERSQLNRSNTPLANQDSELTCGPYHLNLRSLEFSGPTGQHVLTALEADVLSEFMRHKGKVLTREHLLTTVWGMHGNLETRTVDNFIMRLRKVLELDPARPQILESVRGRGYRFNPK